MSSSPLENSVAKWLTPIDWQNQSTALRAAGTFVDDWLNFMPVKKTSRAFVTGKEGDNYHAKVLTIEKDMAWSFIKIMSLLWCASSYTTMCIPLAAIGVKVAARYGVTINTVTLTVGDKEFTILTTREFKAHDVIAELDTRYQEIFRKKGIDPDQASDLQKHVVAFTDDEGNITQGSIEKKFKKMGNSTAFSGICAFTIFHGVKAASQAPNEGIQITQITKARHLSDSQIFTETGNADTTKLSVFKEFAKTDPSLLTFNEIRDLRATWGKRDSDKKGAFSGATVALAEFEIFMSLFSDCVVVNKFGETLKGVKIETLEKLYTMGPFLFDNLEDTKAHKD